MYQSTFDNIWPEGFDFRGGAAVHIGDGVPPDLDWLIENGYTFVAHNAAFDATAWRLLVGGPQPEWYDTMPCARAAGLPGGLDEIGERLLGRGKDEGGKKAMQLLTAAKAKPATGFTYPVGTGSLWDALLRYNIVDVLLLERLFLETMDYGEADVLQADYAINRRGIRINRGFARALQAIWDAAGATAIYRIIALTEGAIGEEQIRSGPQVLAWVESQGVKLGGLDKFAVQRFLDDPASVLDDDAVSEAGDDDPVNADTLAKIGEVLSLRQVAVSATAGKLAALQSRSDGSTDRVYDSFEYFGAGTGRWTSRGVQMQNLARGSEEVDVAKCLDLYERGELNIDSAKECFGDAPLREALGTLIRPVFEAPEGSLLAIADFAGIEARGAAWVSGDEEMLEVFRTGADPYKTMAASIFGVAAADVTKPQRQVGKVVVLGCGYGMGVVKFAALCRQLRIDLEAVGTDAATCIKVYREARRAISQQWKRYDRAVMSVVETGRPVVGGRAVFEMRGPHLAAVLPSGRPIVYRNARIEQIVPPYCKMLGLPEVAKPSVVYAHPRGYKEGKSLYGGLIMENVVQGLCRDLTAIALVRCEADGDLPVVLHVHDEIVCEVDEWGADESLRRLCTIMADAPPWASGFPINVEGYLGKRYTKSPLPGFTKVKV